MHSDASALLHSCPANIADVKGPFTAMHARVFCHATEDLDKVKHSLAETVGPADIRVSRMEGHHGNAIFVLEALVEDDDAIRRFFQRLRSDDLEAVMTSLSSRIDDKCNLHLRLDKQSSFKGILRLGENDDVVSVRVRVRAFPAKVEEAKRIAENYMKDILADRGAEAAGPD